MGRYTCGNADGKGTPFSFCPARTHHLVDRAESIVCASPLSCSVEECCQTNPTCGDTDGNGSPFTSCPTGSILRKHPNSVLCQDTGCTAEHCCDIESVEIDLYSVEAELVIEDLVTATEFNNDNLVIEAFRTALSAKIDVKVTQIVSIFAQDMKNGRRLVTQRRRLSSACKVSFSVLAKSSAQRSEVIAKLSSKAFAHGFVKELKETFETFQVRNVDVEDLAVQSSNILPAFSDPEVDQTPTTTDNNVQKSVETLRSNSATTPLLIALIIVVIVCTMLVVYIVKYTTPRSLKHFKLEENLEMAPLGQGGQAVAVAGNPMHKSGKSKFSEISV